MAVITVKATAENSTKTYITAGAHRILIDEPPSFGGEDEAPSPVEMYLASLAGCINAAGQWIARELSMEIRKLDILIEGEVDGGRFLRNDPSRRAGFESVSVTIELASDADAATQEAWFAQVKERCPVIDNMQNGTRLSVSMR